MVRRTATKAENVPRPRTSITVAARDRCRATLIEDARRAIRRVDRERKVVHEKSEQPVSSVQDVGARRLFHATRKRTRNTRSIHAHGIQRPGMPPLTAFQKTTPA
jgi:hypothetical protein